MYRALISEIWNGSPGIFSHTARQTKPKLRPMQQSRMYRLSGTIAIMQADWQLCGIPSTMPRGMSGLKATFNTWTWKKGNEKKRWSGDIASAATAASAIHSKLKRCMKDNGRRKTGTGGRTSLRQLGDDDAMRGEKGKNRAQQGQLGKDKINEGGIFACRESFRFASRDEEGGNQTRREKKISGRLPKKI
ncbi:hypothetical protein B0H19DRAFT_1059648 [Mycena capillaripes]|nr:hypothetical protein B0H19DRAFT_1059648 [Mycena capillaripes]